jgi:hypothetical protein
MATELKTVDSMPGSINELLSINKRLKRPPSLSDSFAFTPENIERAQRIPLILSSDTINILQEENEVESTKQIYQIKKNQIVYWKYEIQIVEIIIKLLIHITLISIFETLFYFLYISTLENNGINKTVNTFINNAAANCQNISQIDIQIIDDFLEPYINSSQIINNGNIHEILRLQYNKNISNRAWAYVGGLAILFLLVEIFILKRKIQIKWKVIMLENIAMVLLLALYELMFFNTIIYSYDTISTDEIGRNAIEKFQNECGILK